MHVHQAQHCFAGSTKWPDYVQNFSSQMFDHDHCCGTTMGAAAKMHLSMCVGPTTMALAGI
jgi:hypothetical protein